MVDPKVPSAMKNLDTCFYPEVLKMVAEAKSGNKLVPIPESSTIALRLCMELVEPKTFQEALSHPDLKQYMK